MAISGGAIAGAVQTGTMRGALIGAVSAAAFHGIGSYYRGMAATNAAKGTADAIYRGLTAPQFASNVALSSVAGGVMSDLQGGKFGHGMVSAGLSTAASPAFDHISSPAGQVVVAAIIGGTASSITGGKFANGAVTAAFSKAFGRLSPRRAPAADGGLSKQEAEASSWPSIDEANTRLQYARFSLGWLHDQGALPNEFNFAFEGTRFLDFNYNDAFKESWNAPGNVLFAEAPLNASGGPDGPIQFYRAGVSSSDITNFATCAHEVLHRNPIYSIPYQSRQQPLNVVHQAMSPIVNAARAAYLQNQASIDRAWEGPYPLECVQG